MESSDSVDLLDQRAETGLQDAVKLDALAGGEAQGVVAIARGEVVEGDPLRRGHDATRDAAADHHHELLGGLAQVAVILLIDAVKLDELLVILGKTVRCRVGHRRGDIPRERGNGLLDDFVMGELGGFGGGHDNLYS